MTGSGAGAGDTGCLIGEDCDWLNSCRLDRRGGVEFCTSTWFNGVWCSRLIGGELSNSDPDPDPDSDSDLDSSPDPILVVLVLIARPAFWAAVILPRLFSRATALVN